MTPKRCTYVHAAMEGERIGVKTGDFIQCKRDAVEGEKFCEEDLERHKLFMADKDRRDGIFRELLKTTDGAERDALYKRLETGK